MKSGIESSSERLDVKLSKLRMVLLFPIVVPMWVLGWIKYVTGDRKKVEK